MTPSVKDHIEGLTGMLGLYATSTGCLMRLLTRPSIPQRPHPYRSIEYKCWMVVDDYCATGSPCWTGGTEQQCFSKLPANTRCRVVAGDLTRPPEVKRPQREEQHQFAPLYLINW